MSKRKGPIDGRRALRLLRKVVADRPDYVYAVDEKGAYLYFRDGEPSCVVGHVLAKVGWKASDLDDWRNSERVIYFSEEDGFTPDALAILNAAQETQDAGRPWALALASATAEAARIGVDA